MNQEQGEFLVGVTREFAQSNSPEDNIEALHSLVTTISVLIKYACKLEVQDEVAKMVSDTIIKQVKSIKYLDETLQ